MQVKEEGINPVPEQVPALSQEDEEILQNDHWIRYWSSILEVFEETFPLRIKNK